VTAPPVGRLRGPTAGRRCAWSCAVPAVIAVKRPVSSNRVGHHHGAIGIGDLRRAVRVVVGEDLGRLTRPGLLQDPSRPRRTGCRRPLAVRSLIEATCPASSYPKHARHRPVGDAGQPALAVITQGRHAPVRGRGRGNQTHHRSTPGDRVPALTLDSSTPDRTAHAPPSRRDRRVPEGQHRPALSNELTQPSGRPIVHPPDPRVSPAPGPSA